MKQGSVILEMEMDGYRPCGAFGQPVHHAYVQLQAAVAQRLGQRSSHFFARPQIDERSRRIRWIAPVAGTPRSWRDLSRAEQAERALDLQIMRGQFDAYLSELRQSEPSSSGEAFVSVLEQALKIPNDRHLHFIDDQPVVTFWGFSERGGEAFEPLAAAPAAVAPPPDVDRHGVPIWLWWLLPLTLLLLLFAMLWWFYWRGADSTGGLPFADAGEPAAIAESDPTPPVEEPVVLAQDEPVSPVAEEPLLIEEDPVQADEPLPEEAGLPADRDNLLIAPGDRDPALIDAGEIPVPEDAEPVDLAALDPEAVVPVDELPDGAVLLDEAVPVDLDGDGVVDGYDVDGDGVIDDVVGVDADGDGVADTLASADLDALGEDADTGADSGADAGSGPGDAGAEDPAVADGGGDDDLAGISPADILGDDLAGAPGADGTEAEDAPQPGDQLALPDPPTPDTSGAEAPEGSAPDAGAEQASNAPAQAGAPAARDVAFLRGKWRSRSALTDEQGNRIDQTYEFDRSGQGRSVIRRADGVECSAPVQASRDGDKLKISELENLRCADGQLFEKSETVCERSASGQTRCRGSYGGEDGFDVRIDRAADG
ncbi:MAG: hypothetical protein AAF713_09415 [Pseudomonadota bacterium]